MASLRQLFSELSTDQKIFVKQKTISTTLSIKHWIGFFIKTAAYDLAVEKVGKRYLWLVWIAALALLGALLTWFNAENLTTTINWITIVAVLFVLFIWSIAERRKYKKRDIHNYLRLFFMPMLEVMRIKAGEEAKMAASLDFRDPYEATKPSRYTAMGRDVKLRESKFVTARIMLLDQTELDIVCEDDIRDMTWRNANGKTKSRKKTTHYLSVKATVSKQVYKVKTKKSTRMLVVIEEADTITIKSKTKLKEIGDSLLKPAAFLHTVQSVYNQLLPIASEETGEEQVQDIEQVQEPGAPDATAAPTAPDANQLAAPAENPANFKKRGLKQWRRGRTGTASNDPDIGSMMWTDRYFNRYDYDSTRYSNQVPVISGGGKKDKLNVFDS